MRKLITVIAAGCLCVLCMAAPPDNRHSVRLGWGDMLFETLAFHASAPGNYNPEALPADYQWTGTCDHKYTGHIFGEYMYSLTSVTSIGIQADFEGIFWKQGHKENFKQVNNYNLTLLPTVRFTYLRTEWVNLYSSVSLGLLMAFDNQRQFEVAPALNLNMIGIRVGRQHWGGFLELGALTALRDTNNIYMFGSRLVSVGVNYCW